MKADSAQAAFDHLVEAVRQVGFDNVSYMAGLAEEAHGNASGKTVEAIMHVSTCPDDWLEALVSEHGAENDYDIKRFLLGLTAPFVSGYNILGLMEPLAEPQRRILEMKAAYGFAANFVVPLPTAPFARQSYAGLMYISELDAETFAKTLTQNGDRMIALAHLFHDRAGGNAHTFLEREANVKVCVRAFQPRAERVRGAKLTDRQRIILSGLAAGERISAIADQLGLSTVTVERHLSQARVNLGARTTTEAVAITVAKGMLTR